MATCAGCGFDLRNAESVGSASDEQVNRQVAFELAARLGHTAVAAHSDLHSLAFFAGVRSIAQLLLVKRGVPAAMDVKNRAPVERISVTHRNELLTHVWSCLHRWPHDFIERCQSFKGPYTALISGREVQPWWIHSVADDHLRRGVPRLSSVEVTLIEKYVTQEMGKFTLPAARLLTGRDISGHWVQSFPELRPDDFKLLYDHLDRRIEASQGRNQCDLMRDKVMFLAARAMGLPQHKLVNWRVDTIRAAVALFTSIEPTKNLSRSTDDVDWWLGWYLSVVRQKYPDSTVSPWLFVYGRSRQMSESLVGSRFSGAVGAAGLKALFPSYRHWLYARLAG